MLATVQIVPQAHVHQLELFELAPEVHVAAKPVRVSAPRVGMMRWQPLPDGSFKPLIETHPAVVDISRWAPAIYGCSRSVITTLVNAGFVEGERLSPRTLTINLESYFAWRTRMRGDPFFWSDQENRARYAAAMPKKHWRGDFPCTAHHRNGSNSPAAGADDQPLLLPTKNGRKRPPARSAPTPGSAISPLKTAQRPRRSAANAK